MSCLYSCEIFGHGRERCGVCAFVLMCVITVNTSMCVGYGVRASKEGEVENTAFGFTVSKILSTYFMTWCFHFSIPMLEQWFSDFSKHQNYLENRFLGPSSGDSVSVG